MTNLLPTENWRSVHQYNPYHFWGLAGPTVPTNSACNSLVRKYAWQTNDAAGRVDIETAINEAETQLESYLGFAVAPRWVEKTFPFPRYPNNGVYRYGYADATWRWDAIDIGEAYVQDVGIEALDLIDDAIPVVYTSRSGGTPDDTFTITFPTTVTDPAKIGVYLSSADWLDGTEAADNEVRPVKVTISGGVATVKGRSWLLVRPELYEGVQPDILDATDPANYVTTLAAYHHYTDTNGTTNTTAQAMLIWETRPWPVWATCCPTNSSTDPAAEAYAMARVALRDARLGLLGIGRAYYDSTKNLWASTDWWAQGYGCRPPDRVTIRYRAGYPLKNQTIDPEMAKIVAHLSTANLARRICACDAANRSITHDQFDLSRTAGSADEQYIATDAIAACPFGSRRGAWLAWKAVERKRIVRGFTAD